MLYVVHTKDYISYVPLADVLGEAGGLLWGVSQQNLITGERLQKPHVAGQWHGLPHPHTLLPTQAQTY